MNARAILNKLKNNKDFMKACDLKRRKNKPYEITIFTDYEGKNFDVWPRVEIHVLEDFPVKIDTVLESRKEQSSKEWPIIFSNIPIIVEKQHNIKDEIFNFIPKELRITEAQVPKPIIDDKRSAINKNYWDKNKDEINAKRRENYVPRERAPALFDKKEYNRIYNKENKEEINRKRRERRRLAKLKKEENK